MTRLRPAGGTRTSPARSRKRTSALGRVPYSPVWTQSNQVAMRRKDTWPTCRFDMFSPLKKQLCFPCSLHYSWWSRDVKSISRNRDPGRRNWRRRKTPAPRLFLFRKKLPPEPKNIQYILYIYFNIYIYTFKFVSSMDVGGTPNQATQVPSIM